MVNMSARFSPWVIFHVPHDSTLVPSEVRRQITLTDGELDAELIKRIDHLTLSLFASGRMRQRPRWSTPPSAGWWWMSSDSGMTNVSRWPREASGRSTPCRLA